MGRAAADSSRWLVLALAAVATLTAGCSGDGSATPMSPELATQPASIAGQVVSVPAGTVKGGIRITLDQPNAVVTTDSAGRFQFESVTPGNRSLHFESDRIHASLQVGGVTQAESRRLDIALTETSATEDDGKGDDEGDGSPGEDGDDDDQGEDGDDDDQGDDGNDDSGDDPGDDDSGEDDSGDDGSDDDSGG